MAEEIRSFGWMKDKYNPIAKMHAPVVKVIPDVVNLEQYLPNVRNQGGCSSCVGHGVGGTLCTVSKQKNIFIEWDSPNWIYNGARYLEGWLARDCGCYPEDALKWVTDMGRLWESLWPYTGFTAATPTSDGRGDKAIKYPDFDVARVADGADGIMSALADGHPVNIGTPWPDSWGGYKSGILPEINANSSLAGGHDTFLYGYDKTASVFFGQNSWGTTWGIAGRYKMPMSCFSVFKQMGGYDAHYITFSAVPTPPNPTQFALNLSVSPTGKGAVTGGGMYAAEAIVPIRARAVSQYKFSKWVPGTNIANPSSADTVAIMRNNMNVTATFVKKSPVCAGIDLIKNKVGKKEATFTFEEV